jgi:hypothetical protein
MLEQRQGHYQGQHTLPVVLDQAQQRQLQRRVELDQAPRSRRVHLVNWA